MLEYSLINVNNELSKVLCPTTVFLYTTCLIVISCLNECFRSILIDFYLSFFTWDALNEWLYEYYDLSWWKNDNGQNHRMICIYWIILYDHIYVILIYKKIYENTSLFLWVMVFNTTFSNISVIVAVSFLVEETKGTLRKPQTCC